MKSILFIAFSVALVAAVSAKSCTDQGDCDEGQCCAGYMPFRGSCKSMTKAGRQCMVDEEVFPFNDIYIMTCPCDDGLECVAVKTSKKKTKGICQVPTTTEEPDTESPEPEPETEAPEPEPETEAPEPEQTEGPQEEVTEEEQHE